MPGFERLPRITSDCRPFPDGGDLALCTRCGGIQKMPTQRWLDEIASIYSHYAPYHQGEGEEQLSLDASGRLRPRSQILVDRLAEELRLPATGSLLDVGCGNGVTLRAFSKARPDWLLDGYEMNARNSAVLARIPGFRRLHSGEPGSTESGYRLVTMVHTLEHFVEPLSTLRTFCSKLETTGVLFVEVCNIDENPFDVLIADHLLHFSPSTLRSLLCRAGVEPLLVATDWVGKEISAVAGVSSGSQAHDFEPSSASNARVRLERSLRWLSDFAAAARQAATGGRRFGLFGTSIAGTWLASQMEQSIDFFVDEDPSRAGKHYLGKPVIAPEETKPGDRVYLALAPAVASVVSKRMSGHPGDWFSPPGMPAG